jgi:flagellar motor switch protein FliG
MAKKKQTEIVEVVAKCDNLVLDSEIENMIFSFRGVQVMVDRDLAMLYGVETKVLNQAVKRNINRFPERFRFQLSQNETTELVTNCDRLQNLKHFNWKKYQFD